MEQQTGLKLGKEYIKAVCCHPAYLTYMHHVKCWDGWIKQARIKITRRNINSLRYADDTTLMPKTQEELKSSDKVEREWKSWQNSAFKNEDSDTQSHHFNGK